MKQYLIPIFLSNNIILNKQQLIIGKTEKLTKEDIKKIIEKYLENIKEECKIELEFFNFDEVDTNSQEKFLQVASEYLKSKRINGITVSVTSKFINKANLKMLKKYKVKSIELEAVSTNEYLLKKANKKYKFEDIKKASKMIRFNRFKLGYYMEVGLQDGTAEDDINTAKTLIKLKAKMVRIYPIIVFKETELEESMKNGEYKPLTVVQAVEICKELVKIFTEKKVEVSTIGFQTTEEAISDESLNKQIVAGPFHPAFRQIVESSLWYDVIVSKIKKINAKVVEAEICVNPTDVNNVIGYKNETIINLKETYNVDLIITPDEKIKQGESKINIKKEC